MEESVEITLVLTKESVVKLQALAGSDLTLSEYITMVIERLYAEHGSSGNALNIEQIVTVAENLAQQNQNYHEAFGNLRAQYMRLAVSQEELLATIEHLRDTSTRLSETSKKLNNH